MRGLTKKAVFRIGIVCLFIFGLCIVVSIFSTRASMSTQVNENITSSVAQTAMEANEFFARYEAVGDTLATNNIVTSTLPLGIASEVPFVEIEQAHRISKMMDDVVAAEDAAMAVYVACGSKNDTIMSGNLWQSLDFPSLQVIERPWYADAVANNGLAVCDPYIDEITKETVTTISVPIHQGSDIIGVVGFDLSLESVNEILQQCQIGEDSQILTLLPSGVIFYSSMVDEAGEYLPIESVSEELAEYMTDPDATGIIEFKYDGTKYLGCKATIGKTGWVVLSSISKTEAYSTLAKANILLGGLLVLAWIVTMVLVVASFRKLAIKPVEKLQLVADQMAEGTVDLDIPEIPNPSDEVEQLNNSLRNVLENSKMQAKALDALAAGSKVSVNIRSDKDTVNISVQHVVDTLNNLSHEIIALGDSFKQGDTSCRADSSGFDGDFKGLIESINDMVDSIMEPLANIAASVGSLGQGELVTIENNAKGDFAGILNDIQASINNVKALVEDTSSLAEAAISGDLDKRADADKHNGDFKAVIEGINKTLDMVVDKTNWYENIINSVETPIAVSGLDGDAVLFNNAFKEGPLMRSHCDVVGLYNNGITSSDIEIENHIFIQSTVQIKDRAGSPIGYVSSMQDVTSIQKPAEYSSKEIARLQNNLENMASGNFFFDTDRPEVDEYTAGVAEQYGLIDESINKVANAVKALVNDSRAMADAAATGQLDFRLDASAHMGDYSEVIEGLNNTVDLLLRPIHEAVSVLSEIAKGNLTVSMTGTYEGDHNEIKSSLNQTISNLRATIDEIDRTLKEMAECNLTVRPDSSAFTGDFATIERSLESIIDRIGAVMTEIRQSAGQVAGGSKQLSSAAQILADGSTKQASSIEEITNAMGNIASMTKVNAEDATKASQMSSDVMSNASTGNAKMQDMLNSMNEINAASASISKVIKVIDDIAFQTNILALNAAVEAARAGVHGKGFAVVADEVRNLAAKSASAAQESTALIEGSIAKAEQGTVIANEAAAAFEEIVHGITETSGLCNAIAEVSKTQEANVAEVNEAIGNVSTVVQSNSATAEESAAQSEELYAQANLLNQLVEKFKIGSASASSSRPAAIPSREPAPEIMHNDFNDISITLDGMDKY